MACPLGVVCEQRCSVMATDVVLAAAVAYAVVGRPALEQRAAFAAAVSSAGLLVVDHIHFQYNGMLLGALSFVQFNQR